MAEDFKARALARLEEKRAQVQTDYVVVLKLPHRDVQSEVITTIEALRTSFEQDYLGIDDREAESLIRNWKDSRLKSHDVSGFIISFESYRVLRQLGIVDLLW